jgi:hypothetical protein
MSDFRGICLINLRCQEVCFHRFYNFLFLCLILNIDCTAQSPRIVVEVLKSRRNDGLTSQGSRPQRLSFLMSFPPEIRNRIYEATLDNVQHTIMISHAGNDGRSTNLIPRLGSYDTVIHHQYSCLVLPTGLPRRHGSVQFIVVPTNTDARQRSPASDHNSVESCLASGDWLSHLDETHFLGRKRRIRPWFYKANH